MANSDFLPAVGGCILPLIGRRQAVRRNGDDCLEALHQNCKLTDDHLKANKYLVGERVTVADFFLISMLTVAFMAFRKGLQLDYPSLTRWFDDVYNLPMYREVAGDLHLLDLPYPAVPVENLDSIKNKQIETRQAASTVA